MWAIKTTCNDKNFANFLAATVFILSEFNKSCRNCLAFKVNLISSFCYVIDNRKFALISLMHSYAKDRVFFCATSRSFCFLCGMSFHSHKKERPRTTDFNKECARKGFHEIVCKIYVRTCGEVFVLLQGFRRQL